MALEEHSENGHNITDSATDRGQWQFSLRSFFVFITAVAVLFSIGTILGEVAFGLGLFTLLILASIVAYMQPSQVARLLACLIALQFFGGALLAPGDGGLWLARMYRLYLAVDIFLAARLYLFYKFARRPEPRLSWLVKVAIITSPIYMAAIATYLMETYGVFR